MDIFFEKLGMPKILFWGYVGLIFFMLGSTIECTWFSATLIDLGYGVNFVSTIFSFYGLLVAIVSWISGALVNRFSIRKVMNLSVLFFFVSLILLLTCLHLHMQVGIAIAYGLRGAAYPLFAYSFLIWITLRTRKEQLGRATSWFWFCFNLGMNIIAPVFSSYILKYISFEFVLLIGAILVIVGTYFTLIRNRDIIEKQKSNVSFKQELMKGLILLGKKPRVCIGMLVKIINNIGSFGFVIMMPILLIARGYTLVQWTTIWAMTYISNCIATIIFGHLGDYFGWRKILVWFSGTLTAFSCIMIALVIYQYPGNYILLLLSFLLFSIGVAAYAPLSALLPAMIPENKVEAVSILNLGSGLSNFVGPLLVTLLFKQTSGFVVLIVFACLYAASSILSVLLKTPEEI
ncbi:RbtT/DalT/CsbX family MFS transporter [Absicoccus porci]|uniref:RbtT/DalT/CsbX family MFS transporter n=1 Tax=Absicoccus porci TaxID=2486576 RepID=UPI003F8AF594